MTCSGHVTITRLTDPPLSAQLRVLSRWHANPFLCTTRAVSWYVLMVTRWRSQGRAGRSRRESLSKRVGGALGRATKVVTGWLSTIDVAWDSRDG